MAWFEKEQRLKNLSPQHKEVWINSYGGKLGIASNAFKEPVADYLDKQDKALQDKIDPKGYDFVLKPDSLDDAALETNKIYLSNQGDGEYIVLDQEGNKQTGTLKGLNLTQLKDNLGNPELKKAILAKTSKAGHAYPKNYSSDQIATYNKLENLKIALRDELKTFTAAIDALPSNTHAEALANEATEEKKLIIEKLKLLNQQTRVLTNSLPDTKQAGAEDTSHQATSTPGATAGTGTGGRGSPWAGTGTGTGTSSDEEATLDADVETDTVPTPAASGKTLSPEETAALSDALDATKKSLEDDPELDKLEKQLTGAITDMHRAAQLERDRIPLLAVLTANKRKLSLFTSTIENLSEHGLKSLWSEQKASPPSVLVTGNDQTGVEKLRAAMRKLNLSGQEQEKLDNAKKDLEKAQTRLEKAKKDNDQDNIDKHEKEIEEYNKKISELNQKTTLKTQEVAAELQGNAGNLGLVGYSPGLAALSGRKIEVGANGQGLTFTMHFPTPLFSPGYYLSREHNTKADLVSMAELIKATGAQNIYFNIECRNPKMKQRLMQEAYEAALEVGGFKSITINGQEITKENMHEKLYKHTDPNTREETNKYQRKEQLAQQLQGIADRKRSEVESKHGGEIKEQQTAFKHAMHAERTALEKAAQKITGDTPTPPSDEHGASAIILPSS